MRDATGSKADATLERVLADCEGLDARPIEARDRMPSIATARADLRAVLLAVRRAGFETNTFVTAIDRYPAEPRFELYHQFHSLEHGDRVRVRIQLSEDDPAAPTCIDLWPGAAYAERECFDMFGIRFDGHEGLKRLLMPEAYEHHPLRKDFPHQGIEPDKLYNEWRDRRRDEWLRGELTSSS